MKSIFKIGLGLALISTAMSSCDKIEESPTAVNEIGAITNFVESVAILQTVKRYNDDSRYKAGGIALTVQLKDFSNGVEMRPAYMIDNIEYCDNGKYNDEVSGDGVYTSVEKFSNDEKKSGDDFEGVIIHKSDDFKFEKDLKDYLKTNISTNSSEKLANSGPSLSIKLGCKLRTVTCPETSWLNSCWFGSPCTCIEYFDCEGEVVFTWD